MRGGPIAVIILAASLLLATWTSGLASASTWVVPLGAASHGEATSQTLPLPSPSAACVSAGTKTIKITWSATSHATYTVYESNTTVGGTYNQVATGLVTGTWTSASLANGNYWFKVSGAVGINWLTGQSAATGETTIQNGATKCVQP